MGSESNFAGNCKPGFGPEHQCLTDDSTVKAMQYTVNVTRMGSTLTRMVVHLYATTYYDCSSHKLVEVNSDNCYGADIAGGLAQMPLQEQRVKVMLTAHAHSSFPTKCLELRLMLHLTQLLMPL